MSIGPTRDLCRPRLAYPLLLLAIVGACTLGDNPFHTANPQRVIGDGMAVSITNVHNESEAQPFADDYCRARGRTAQFAKLIQYRAHHVTSMSASFDCVQGHG
jgi:hypothetical protein